LPDAVAPRRYTYGVEDLAGTLHTFPSQAEADEFASGALKRGVISGLKNPFGSVMKIGGRVAGESPEQNNRLYEVGDNLIGEGAAAAAKAAGAPDEAQTAVKKIGDAAQYAIPYVGQARFYGGLAGKALAGEAPSTGDLLNTAMDTKNIARARDPSARPRPDRRRTRKARPGARRARRAAMARPRAHRPKARRNPLNSSPSGAEPHCSLRPKPS
jgi:hypothetical protein